MRFSKFLFAAALFVPLSASADSPWLEIPKHFQGDFTQTFSSSSLSVAAATAASAVVAHEYADDTWQVDHPKQLMGWGAPVLSNVGFAASLSSPALFFIASRLIPEGNSQRAYTTRTSEELLEGLIWTLGCTQVLKWSVSRSRPDRSDDRSFPSMHASAAFASAGTVAFRYPWYVGVPSLAFAGAIAFSRVDLKKHFASDVLAGAGIGLFFSTAVHRFHAGLDRNVAVLVPIPYAGAGGAGLTWNGRF